MTIETKEILEEVLALPPVEKANLVDNILSSLDQPDERLDALWYKEVEDRIDAYKAGRINTVSLEQVLAKYNKR